MAIVTAIQSSLRPSLLESSAASAASEAEGEEKPDSIEALSTSSNDKTLRELTSRFSRMVSLEALEG